MASPLVVLLTDFGCVDSFVGAMKGAILQKAPKAVIVDLCHHIPQGDIRAAAFQLMISFQYFPPKSLFVSVVDPGVGSGRKILYAKTARYRFLAPDNGLLSWTFEKQPPLEVREVKNQKLFLHPVSRTFHGRDIFAPAAGALLSGTPPSALGPAIKNYRRIPFPRPRKTPSGIEGEILSVDRFGNLITNLTPKELPPPPYAFHAGRPLRNKEDVSAVPGPIPYGRALIPNLSKCYQEVSTGKLLAIQGSSGYIEISVRDGNASQKLRLKTGGKIQVVG